MKFYIEKPFEFTFFDSFEDMIDKTINKKHLAYNGMIIDLADDCEKKKKGIYILVDCSDPTNVDNWKPLELGILNEEKLKILLRNTIDAYEDECDMNSPEHFVEKLKEETGITNEEYNELFKGDRQILEDGSVVTDIEEE